MEDKELKYLRQNIRLWGVKNGLETLLEVARNVEPAWLGEEMYRVIVGMQDSLKDLPTMAELQVKE
jgi:hypothetical protein